MDPIRTLLLSEQNASLDFLCPYLTERFRPALKSTVTGHAEISEQIAKVRISGQCMEGTISIEVSDPTYVSALKKARKEFAHNMTLWMLDRYGPDAKAPASEALIENEHQIEAERIRLLHHEHPMFHILSARANFF
jgi:hypothetical protein